MQRLIRAESTALSAGLAVPDVVTLKVIPLGVFVSYTGQVGLMVLFIGLLFGESVRIKDTREPIKLWIRLWENG